MIDYDLNEQLADREDLDQLKNMGINLKLDFILNHASAQSPQFRDLVEKIASYGAAIVRLDAFAYAPKTPGKKTFSMIRKRGNFYRKSMRWQNLGDLRFCRRSSR